MLANDTDPDFDSLVVFKIDPPLHGYAEPMQAGIRYSPFPGYVGSDAFTYVVSDGRGGFSTALCSISILPVYVPPIALDDAIVAAEGGSVDFNPLINDLDTNPGATLELIAVAQAQHGSTVVVSGALARYMPSPHFHGIDWFKYLMRDESGVYASALVSVTVLPQPASPGANPLFASGTRDSPITFTTVTLSAYNPDGVPLRIVSVTQPVSGSVDLIGNDSFVFSPSLGFSGPMTFTYELGSTGGSSSSLVAGSAVTVTPNTAVVTIIVGSTPGITVSSGQSQTMAGVPVLLYPQSLASGDTSGLSVLDVNATQGFVLVNGNGTLLYVPADGFSGNSLVRFNLKDRVGRVGTGTISVTVVPVPTPPLAKDDFETVSENGSTTFDVRDNDIAHTGTLSVTSFTPAYHGDVTLVLSGGFIYTPYPNYFGSDAFTYKIIDDSAIEDYATVHINVTPIDHAPTARNDLATVQAGHTVSIPVLLNDSDLDAPASTLTVESVFAISGYVSTTGDHVVYTALYGPARMETLTYVIRDQTGLRSSATVTVFVDAGQAPAPTATPIPIPKPTVNPGSPHSTYLPVVRHH